MVATLRYSSHVSEHSDASSLLQCYIEDVMSLTRAISADEKHKHFQISLTPYVRRPNESGITAE